MGLLASFLELILNVSDGLSDGLQFVSIIVRNLDIKRLLELHHQLRVIE